MCLNRCRTRGRCRRRVDPLGITLSHQRSSRFQRRRRARVSERSPSFSASSRAAFGSCARTRRIFQSTSSSPSSASSRRSVPAEGPLPAPIHPLRPEIPREHAPERVRGHERLPVRGDKRRRRRVLSKRHAAARRAPRRHSRADALTRARRRVARLSPYGARGEQRVVQELPTLHPRVGRRAGGEAVGDAERLGAG